jgi:hypothetical protein
MHEQSLAFAEAAGDAAMQNSCLGNLRNSYSAIGQLIKAIEMHERSLAVWLHLNDRARQGGAYGNQVKSKKCLLCCRPIHEGCRNARNRPGNSI